MKELLVVVDARGDEEPDATFLSFYKHISWRSQRSTTPWSFRSCRSCCGRCGHTQLVRPQVDPLSTWRHDLAAQCIAIRRFPSTSIPPSQSLDHWGLPPVSTIAIFLHLRQTLLREYRRCVPQKTTGPPFMRSSEVGPTWTRQQYFSCVRRTPRILPFFQGPTRRPQTPLPCVPSTRPLLLPACDDSPFLAYSMGFA